MARKRSSNRRGWHAANGSNSARGRRRGKSRVGFRFSWGELRLVVLGGILAGLSFAAMPDDWRSGALAALPNRMAQVVAGGVTERIDTPTSELAALREAASAAPEAARRYVGDALVGDLASGAARVDAGNRPPERAHARFARCSGPVRVNCVVDGDTFWMDGEKIRIADLNAPEVSSPRCTSEARLGARATDALIVQLNAGPFALETIDRNEDRYGRKLRRVTRGVESVGEAMVGAGVARWYGEGRREWC